MFRPAVKYGCLQLSRIAVSRCFNKCVFVCVCVCCCTTGSAVLLVLCALLWACVSDCACLSACVCGNRLALSKPVDVCSIPMLSFTHTSNQNAAG